MSENWESLAIRATVSLKWALHWLEGYMEPIDHPNIEPTFVFHYRNAKSIVRQVETIRKGIKDGSD